MQVGHDSPTRVMRASRPLSVTFLRAYSSDSESMSVATNDQLALLRHPRSGYMQDAPVPKSENERSVAYKKRDDDEEQLTQAKPISMPVTDRDVDGPIRSSIQRM